MEVLRDKKNKTGIYDSRFSLSKKITLVLELNIGFIEFKTNKTPTQALNLPAGTKTII